jgi:stress-induced-phosphoprotein 1
VILIVAKSFPPHFVAFRFLSIYILFLSLLLLEKRNPQQFKSAGNAALQAGNVSEAIEQYTKAINEDGANHVYYSNRSAAYLQKGDAQNALEDAKACLGLNPQFAKAYSRKGAALHALKRYNDSIAAYNQGLENFPEDAGLTKGLADVTREKDQPFGFSSGGAGRSGGGGGADDPNDPMAGGLFGPQMMAQMATDPRMRPYLSDPHIMGKIKMVQQNPSLIATVMSDPKMMEFLGIMMGQDRGDDSSSSAPYPATTPASAAAAKKEEKVEDMQVEEDWSNLSAAEQKQKEAEKASQEKKVQGNKHYQAKEFDQALAAYDEAIALDPTNMTFLSNKAAVYFTQKKYDECIEECAKAVEVGKANRAPFEDRAKAMTRSGKAYHKKKEIENAIEMYKNAQLESFDKDTQRLLKNLELEKKKFDFISYQNPEKAEEAKQSGNDHFRAQRWGEAVKDYEDAVKRAPKDAPIRNNLSAALCKILDFNGAKNQVDKALELDPQYVKAWVRKGDIEIVMKEHHKALDSYKRGLELDPANNACKEGLRKVTQLINYGRQNMTEDQKKEQSAHAMADPEIQAILTDPVVQQVLRDFGDNPDAAQKAMRDPGMRSKIEKLIASGVVERG